MHFTSGEKNREIIIKSADKTANNKIKYILVMPSKFKTIESKMKS